MPRANTRRNTLLQSPWLSVLKEISDEAHIKRIECERVKIKACSVWRREEKKESKMSTFFLSVRLSNGLNKQTTVAFSRPSIIRDALLQKEGYGHSIIAAYSFNDWLCGGIGSL